VEASLTFAEYLAEYLAKCSVNGREPKNRKQNRFYVSDLTPRIEKIAKIFYGENIRLERVAL
jgi:hypothetical protein